MARQTPAGKLRALHRQVENLDWEQRQSQQRHEVVRLSLLEDLKGRDEQIAKLHRLIARYRAGLLAHVEFMFPPGE